jgi:pilus assembly protein Flp/PilA
MYHLIAKVQSMLANREQGATAVEYGLLVALIAVVIIAGVTLLGTKLLAMFNSTAGHL